MTPLYTAVATATGDGRDGKVRSSDGLLETAVATPAELGGAGGATNPEQLFAAGYAACFHSALRVVARRAKVEPGDTEVTARVGIGRAGAGFGLAVTLEITMPGLPADTARQLVEAAHQVCPYSNATRGNIDVQLVLR
ncbi:organic hydroperoxide resistance protein [Catellatospora bangladeshensis]|uniref:Putative organic hydroperoxide resistance protein/OsmC-like protein n=1 Tax=Catellatospora bangladeshensis TaxID=310355 RepID=A0A8J3JQH5_9ACTN|nr:organic hydroperoxide resistance protein [Catellatospora bangladeshensis]GIF85066.1 putative organic hydroperoxide resistance protein/OsmC-like protein [Catellatospora bangladeshensis]